MGELIVGRDSAGGVGVGARGAEGRAVGMGTRVGVDMRLGEEEKT
jgi:hypothetical protein